jgi:hypothetical protein
MPSFRAVMIVISVFVAVLSDNPKSPIPERQAITGALCAYYQATDTGVTSQIILPDMTNIQNQCLYLIVLVFPSCHRTISKKPRSERPCYLIF